MKKLSSLIKASMTSDMNIFKINIKNNNKKANKLIPIGIALYLMFLIWSGTNGILEKLSILNLQYIILPFFAFGISIMTFMEGIYKVGSLLFNCKDDDLLLSLPIKKEIILFIRIFKFYFFELLFNSLFLLPIMIAYIRWGNINYTYFITSIIMLIFLPIIPIILSTIIGLMTTSLASRFKYKNAAQIIISMLLLIIIMVISFNAENLINTLINNATSINDFITKIYYPSGVYANLITNFNILDLILFVIINILILTISIIILSKFYFKINSRTKRVITNKKVKINDLIIKKRPITISLIKKEFNTFFKTPVFIINAGFALVLFIVGTIIITIKFDSVVPILTDPNGINLSKDIITNNLSIMVYLLIIITGFMTSITNSIISLEGRNINILKSLPLKTKTILMSKVYSSLLLTTPILLIGSLILIIKFKISIIEALLLIILAILIPLVSHFIGLIVNLKYPKLDAENSTEVVKQSMSSFISVMIGMLLLIINIVLVTHIISSINSTLVLLISVIIYLIINLLLYLYLINKSVKDFDKLSI